MIKSEHIIAGAAWVIAWGGLFFLGWLLHKGASQPCPAGTQTIEGYQAGRYTHLCVSGEQPFDGIEQLEVKP